MDNLNTQCFTVQDGKIIEGVLNDFRQFIETTTRPTGVGYKHYVTSVNRGGDDVWALAMWATWAGPEIVVREFESEEEANAALEEVYVYDILHNPEITIHLERSEAEQELSELSIQDGSLSEGF